MVDFASLIDEIQSVYNVNVPCTTVPSVYGFPLPEMYPGQRDAIEEMRKHQSCVLSSHTGAGKTATFLTMAKDVSTLIIEPRKFLQKQVQEYRNDVVLFGRSEYPCYHAENAAVAPCNRKTTCLKEHSDKCEYRTDKCASNPCKVFLSHGKMERYPCTSCKYVNAMQLALTVLDHGGTVVSNFGNFWVLRDRADLIIIDEADLFFREISSPRAIQYASDQNLDVKKLLDAEAVGIQKELQSCTIQQYYRLVNAGRQVGFLRDNHELCFAYRKRNKRNNEQVYIEINPANTNILKDRLFENKRLIIVTATPSEFNLPSVNYSIWQRCRIFYTPVAKLTSRELKMKPWILGDAAKYINEMSAVFGGIYKSEKFVVHCGNIGTHATTLDTLLKPENCTLHRAGNLMQTIDEFKTNSKKYLLVASAEYGADFSWCNCQFVLKVPFASYDDKMKALERKMGKFAFNRWYTSDAITRLIQQCGRVGRGWGSFGITFILDAKFSEIYRMNEQMFPQWFKERLHPGWF